MGFISEKKFENVDKFNNHLSQVIDWIEMGKFQGKKIEWNPNNGEYVAQIDTLIKNNSDYLKPDPNISKGSELEQWLEISKRTKTYKRLNKLGRVLYKKQEPWEQIEKLITKINKQILKCAPRKSFESLPPTPKALILSMLPASTDKEIKKSLKTLKAFMVTDEETPGAMYHWITNNRIPLEKLDLKRYEIESIVSNLPKLPMLTVNQMYLALETANNLMKDHFLYPWEMANWIKINKISRILIHYSNLTREDIDQMTPYFTYFNLCHLSKEWSIKNVLT